MSLFNELFGDIFGGKSLTFGQYNDQFEKETFEVTKGNYKTEATLLFTKEGRYVGSDIKTEYIQSEEDKQRREIEDKIQLLENEKAQAMDNQDYERCAQIRDQIKELRKPTEQKQVTN